MPAAVLFVCSMNAVRSPMAAAILRHLAGHRVRVASAGVRAGDVDGFAGAVMNELGIDITDHRPRALADLDGQTFDLVVSLSPEAHHQALELTRTMAVDVEYWPTLDATINLGRGNRNQMLSAYRKVRDDLFKRIRTRFRLDGGPSL
ncbi:MAG: low molecular weight phosphatase family protein [Hyphomicrobiaceae bacterium]